MTREERNRKISEMRDPLESSKLRGRNGKWETLNGAWFSTPQLGFDSPPRFDSMDWHPKDWHADANWPTLLREMPSNGDVELSTMGGMWIVDHGVDFNLSVETDPADAVCEAWLKWKESQ